MAKPKLTPKKFKCKVCGKILSNRQSLEKHSLLHTDDRPFICNLCSHTFTTKKYLAAHNRKVHRTATKHTCEYCGRKFHFKSLLQQHLYKHTNERPFKCEECGKGFNSGYTLSTHKHIHADSKPFQCKFCEYACRDSSTLRKHQERHMGITRLYECNVCHKSYKTRNALKTHVAVLHLKIVAKNHPCPLCNHMFSTKTKVNRHIKIVHEKLYSCECDICGAKIGNKYNMMAHLTKHIDIRPFRCDFKGCTKRYKDKSTLKKHSVLHFPDKHYVCNICDKRFTRIGRFRKHKEQHQVKIKNFKCDYCGKRFFNKNYVRSHIVRKHMIQEHYICDLCGLLTYNKPSIVMHLKYGHVSEADRQCNICKKKFKRHIYLKAHYWNTHCVKYKMTRTQRTPKKIKLNLIAEESTDVKALELLHEIKVEALSDSDLEGREIEYSQGVQSEEINRVLSNQNKNLTPEENFEDFFIQHIINPSTMEDDDNVNNIQRNVNKLKQEALEKLKQARQMKRLEKEGQEYDASNIKNENIDITCLDNNEANTNVEYKVTMNKAKEKILNSEVGMEENDTQNENNNVTNEYDLPESLNHNDDKTNNILTENDDNHQHNFMNELTEIEHNNDIINNIQQQTENKISNFDANSNPTGTLQQPTDLHENYLKNDELPKDGDPNIEIIDKIQREMRINELINERISTHVYYGTDKPDRVEKNVGKIQNKNDHRNVVNETKINKNIEEMLMESGKPRTRRTMKQLKKILTGIDDSEPENGNDNTDDDYQPGDEIVEEKNTSNKFKINIHQCYTCFKLYDTKEELLDHCKQHFEICSTKMLKKCPLCDFVTNSDLRRHVRLIHKLNLNVLYGTLKDRKNNNNQSRFYLNVDNSGISEIEVIPSIKNLNRQAFLKIDRQRRENNDKALKKTKLIKKDGEWIVEKEAINTKAENYVLPDAVEKEDLLNVDSEDYLGKMKKLSRIAKKNGQKMLFPCDKCPKICQTLSALKLHSRRHDPNAKPFKKKVWKHKLKEGDKQKLPEQPRKIVSENRYAKPKPIINKHKCDPKLKSFYENNIKGGDIEFWQFLKIFNKMSRENVNDFSDLENRTEFGIHCYKEPESEEVINVPKEKNRIYKKGTKIKNGVFKRTIMISKKQYENRKIIKEGLRLKAMEARICNKENY